MMKNWGYGGIGRRARLKRCCFLEFEKILRIYCSRNFHTTFTHKIVKGAFASITIYPILDFN